MTPEHTSVETTLGLTATLRFPSFGNKEVAGKVDTGATTSCIHAEDIQVDERQSIVMFKCPQLSENVIKLSLVGSQEVHSADAGGQTRPMVSLDVEIEGVSVKGASFNLNDRSEMDSPILIGQNLLQQGNFVVDPSQSVTTENAIVTTLITPTQDSVREAQILHALTILSENDVSLPEIVLYLKTLAVNNIKE